MRSQKQIQFQQCIKSLDMQLQIFQNPKSSSKLTQDRLNDLSSRVKNLKKVFTQMDDKMKSNIRNRNFNEYDIKNKLKKHHQQMQKINERYRKIQDKLLNTQKAQLMNNRQLMPGEIDDFKRAHDHLNRINDVHRQANETLDIYTGINEEVARHRGVLEQINNDAGQFEHQLSMSDQLLRVIANRQLVTKLMLVLLVFFLGLADFLILLVKIL